jgi:16S rRNA (guanine966-N2)-methyltransferase
MLSPRLDGAYFLDLFAGSGQIGLEAVSRGSAYCVFVENNKKACQVIEHNINFTKLGEQCRLIQTDAASALRRLEGQYRFDLIFMDPPYKQESEPELLRYLSSSALLAEDGLIIIEADEHTDFSYVGELGYEIVREKLYKTNKHVFLARPDAQENVKE